MGIVSVLAALSLASTDATAGGSDGECAWRRLPEAARREYVVAFQRGIDEGGKVLRKHDPAIRSAFNACAGRTDVPKLWATASVASRAIQAKTIEALRKDGISVSQLDAAWKRAPEAARACTRANAAKVFGIAGQVCPNRAAPMSFLKLLGISPTANRAAANNALYYFNAKAQSAWADYLINRMKAER